MAGSVNKVVLLGTIGKYGVEMKFATTGTPCASFTMVLTEQGQNGQFFSTLVPCQLWGKNAEAASEIEAGTACVFEGKLAKRRKGEDAWEICVSGFELTPIEVPAPVGG